MMMNGYNTARKILASVELSKEQASRLNDLNEVTNAILNDLEPDGGKEFKGEKAASEADMSMNDGCTVEVFTNKGCEFIFLSMTFVEMYNTDDDGDFLNGCDYQQTCEFSDEQKQKIREFCGF